MFNSLVSKSLQSLLLLIGTLPLKIRRFLAKLVGCLIANFPSRDRDVCQLQLKVYNKNIIIKPKDVYQHLVTVLFEACNLKPILNSIHLLDDSELTKYWDNHDQSRGIVALSAHLGNWELIAASAMKHGVPLQVIGKEARNSIWQAALERLRKRYGAVVLWRADSAAIKKIIQTLRSGKVVAALIDQDTDVTSVFSPFFGIKAKTPCSLIELGLKTKSIFVTALTVRDSSGKYTIEVRDIDTNDNSTVESILNAYHLRLQQLIQKHPEQWVWVHKRWRSREDGSRMSSREYIEYLRGIS
jgi:lauroyl/myristoyl acyltransferase